MRPPSTVFMLGAQALYSIRISATFTEEPTASTVLLFRITVLSRNQRGGDFHHNLIGSFCKLISSAIAPNTRNPGLFGITLASYHLHRIGGDLGCRHGYESLRQCRRKPAIVASRIDFPCGLIQHGTHGANAHLHVGDQLGYLLEIYNALPEATTLDRSRHRILEGALRHAQT